MFASYDVENLSNFRSFSSSIYYQYGIVPDSYISTAVHLLNKEANFYFCRPIVMTEFQTIIPMLDQLRMGLESFCLLEALQSKKKILQPLFLEGSSFFKPTRDLILDSVVAEFSEDGTNAKIKEIDIFKYFHDFIMDCNEKESE